MIKAVIDFDPPKNCNHEDCFHWSDGFYEITSLTLFQTTVRKVRLVFLSIKTRWVQVYLNAPASMKGIDLQSLNN